VTQVEGRRGLPYVAALDGLRAIAVLAVVAYHASLDQAPGGFFGVDVFFVISGYLVTFLFLARADERRGPGRADTIDFWRRRLMRLVPAALGAVVVSWLVFAALNVRSVGNLTSEALAAMSYVANWFFLFREQSYFETISQPSPFLHFWSLAVEAQFYLLWPVLLIGAIRFGGRLSAFALAVSLAAISTLVVASLYDPLADPSRAYYGTDARVAGLLLGAALAIVVRPGFSGAGVRAAVEGLGWAGLVTLVFLVTQVSEFDSFIYRGGFFIASTATLGVMLAALHGNNSVAWILALRPLRWIGERSYSIYLWHWPVFVLTQPQLSIELRSMSLLAARLGATLILAELSYRLVEMRFRGRGGALPAWATPSGWTVPQAAARLDAVQAAWQHVRAGTWKPALSLGSGPYLRRPWTRPAAVVVVGLVAVIAAGGLPIRAGLADQGITFQVSNTTTEGSRTVVGLPPATDTASPTAAATGTSPTESPTAAASSTPEVVSPASVSVPPTATPSVPATAAPTAEPSAIPPGSVSGASSTAEPSSGTAETVPGSASTPTPALLGATVTAIGDSVMLGAIHTLAEALPGAILDAEVGRQFWSAPALIEDLRSRDALGEIVVIHLGANGPFSKAQFEAVMEALSGVRMVIFVNVTVPRRWETDVNDALAARVAEYDNATLLDWHGVSAEEADYFASDGVHLTVSGGEAYANLLRQAVDTAVASLGD
jgi:peptidoglycan/LPS O-acetylase OafA/YrhL